MKRKTKFLKFYKKWMKTGRMYYDGLCVFVRDNPDHADSFNFFRPNKLDMKILRAEGLSGIYWASGVPYGNFFRQYAFTELRQNIMLFCATINNEL